MFRPRIIGHTDSYTGIDLGSSHVKLVRGESTAGTWRPTHAGVEPWGGGDAFGEELERRSAEALVRLLSRLGLSKRQIGRIAVATVGDEAQAQEVVLPRMSETDLRRALPFEVRKHFVIDGWDSPCLDLQVLGPAPAEQIRVLLVAASRTARDVPVRTLQRLGLEPEVVDLPGLANLNALLAHEETHDWKSGALGVLDLGDRHAELGVTHPSGGLLMRRFSVGVPAEEDAASLADYAAALSRQIRETTTYYRGRRRCEVSALRLAGGGALLAGLPEALAQNSGVSIRVLDPTSRWGEEGLSVSAPGQCLVTAFGLSHRWTPCISSISIPSTSADELRREHA